MSKNFKVSTAGKTPRSLDYEPQIGDEVNDSIAGLQIVTRKVFDEVNNQIVIYLEQSPNPFP
ncbi:hypothetical protein C4J87_0825 [Pseudomonas sp. R1-43-08]|uniref:hypothetical protein n=1 Tax=unclassified Pseudomonas TaxID=196821 RepID=UPI000F56A3C3|nr:MULTISPECIES: hypothetical protein [unclassified Pseudomonas]AZF35626.1 hypothetical protein C4J88_0827 [Pseudomonas sp. R4-39-08]AZF41000.1 hypothetical protein C4J87_0825 [Pseudomonas sp. R1-43-08]AZF51318.1 hypothetical protein C4J85_0817 [Pseudomonas sp. R4-34-07]